MVAGHGKIQFLQLLVHRQAVCLSWLQSEIHSAAGFVMWTALVARRLYLCALTWPTGRSVFEFFPLCRIEIGMLTTSRLGERQTEKERDAAGRGEWCIIHVVAQRNVVFFIFMRKESLTTIIKCFQTLKEESAYFPFEFHWSHI